MEPSARSRQVRLLGTGEYMSPRVYVRKFDWDEARRRHAAGESQAALAREYGVSAAAVHLAVNDEARAREREYRAQWQRSGVCPDCGTQSTRRGGSGRSARCLRCAGKLRTFTARPDELLCSHCKAWKPDEEFYLGQAKKLIARRGRKHQCRSCDNAARKDYRKRNREADNAYQRKYKKKRRRARMAAG